MGSKIRVLVVDDSTFFRKRIVEIINADPLLEVVGSASNGREAVEQALLLRPDVITMDIEMPEMNGIEAVRRISAKLPTPILMFSSLTYDGAKATLEALEAGAVDFLPKHFESVSRHEGGGRHQLCDRVAAITRRPASPRTAPPPVRREAPPPPVVSRPLPGMAATADRVLVIGASTGGPVALQGILAALPAEFAAPVVVAIHMPANFTTAFADRLNSLCRVKVKEAQDGDAPAPGLVLIAPGGKQLIFEKRGVQSRVQVRDGAADQIYRPSVDVLFGSAARAFGAKVLALVLTGMGADGLQGARLLKQAGATLWSQNEASCVVYGMPQAVEHAGLSDRVLPLNEIGRALAEQWS